MNLEKIISVLIVNPNKETFEFVKVITSSVRLDEAFLFGISVKEKIVKIKYIDLREWHKLVKLKDIVLKERHKLVKLKANPYRVPYVKLPKLV